MWTVLLMTVGEVVDRPVSESSSISKDCGDSVLDRETEREEVAV